VIWSPTSADPTDTHAGHVETSVMLAIDPARVRMDRAQVGTTARISDVASTLRENGVRAISENGVLGDPTRASADDGRIILDTWTRSLVDAVHTWLREKP
jgi:creatinine amidohydrolase